MDDPAPAAFGFLRASTLHSINELGNWKMRSAAIEQVQRGLAGLTPAQAQQLGAQLPAFVGFVLQLLRDHNFKVVSAGLAALADAAHHLGPRLQPHVSTLVPVLHEKLLDQRTPVAAAASRACVSLMQAACSEAAGFVDELLQLQDAAEAGAGGAQQDASALLEVLLWAQLKGPAPGALESRAASRLLLGATQQQAGGSSSKQHALAMEGFALLADALGPKLPALLKQVGASDLAVTQVLTQCRQLQRPLLAPDGSTQHNSAVLAAAAAAEAAVSPISSGGSSFRITSASAGGVDSTRSGGGGAQHRLTSGSNSSSKLGVADSDGGNAWQQQQQLPPGSLGAFAAHAQLLLSTTSSIAAAATASRGGSTINTGGSINGLGSRPVSGSIHTEGSHGPGSEQHQQLLHSGGTQGPGSSLRGSGGSISSIAAAAAAAGQHVQVQLSHMQLNRPGQEGSQHAADADTSAGMMQSQAAAAAGPGSVAQNMRNQHQLDSSSGGHQPSGFNAAGDQGEPAEHRSSNGGGWSSAVTGGGWAPSDPSASLESAPLCSGRAEALSPNRGERLAHLKRRQVEKRATSAVGSTRASNPWDSNDSSISAATAALSAAGDASLTASLTGAEGMLLQARRASTAGGSPGSSLTSSWRLSNAGAVSTDGGGSGSEGGAPPPMHIGSSSGRGALLNWHIPTGADGRFITPSAVISTQQHQQQQQFGSGNSQQSWGEAARSGSSSPSGWGSSRSASRAVQGHVQAGTNSSSSQQQQQQQQQQQPYRSVSAAAVLTAAGGDAQADSSSGSPGQRSSRFQQGVGAGSASPPPAASSTTGPGSPLSSSRLNSGSGLWMLRQQQQQAQAQGMRTQSAAAALGAAVPAAAAAAAAGTSDWGSSTSSRLGSAGAPLSSTGGLHTGTLGSPTGSGSSSRQQTGAGASGGPGSPSRQMVPSLSGRSSNGLRGMLGLETRPASVGAAALAGDADLEALELSPLSDPEATLRQTLLRLQQANTAARKEMDWQAQLEALLGARRLVAHHAEVLRPAARELILAALPAVEELRSTTARMAIMLFQELPGAIGGFERELDDMVLVLLKRAGDLSTAGRDNFLAQQADKALSGVCNAVSESRALSALVAAGAKHKSPHVRCRAAAHLDEVAAGGAGLEALLRSGNWAVLDRVFKAAAGFLQEGSLDTRTYAKRLVWAVKAALRGNRADVDRLLSGVSPEAVQRRVVEVLEGLSGPPPPPAASRGSSSGAPRLASRGTSSGCSTPTGGAAAFGAQPPFSAPPAGHAAAAGGCAAFEGAPASVGRPGGSSGYGSVGSTSGNSAARRALFGSGGSTGSGSGGYGLHVQGASGAAGGGSGSAAGSPVSPSAAGLLLGSGAGSTSGRRRRSVVSGGDADGCERRLSTGPPPGPPGPMSPELQEAVEQVGVHLASKDWRNRMDALRALTALLPALPEVPNGPLEGLLAGLVARLADGNAKVNQKALEVLCDVAGVLGLRVLLVLPALLPALTANLGSSNEKLRSCAAAALDATAAAVAAQPQGLLQGLAHAVASGSTRSRVAVIDKLQLLLPQVHQLQPQLTKLLLPSAFALALEARGELKPAALQLLASLAALLGPGSLLAAAAVVSSAVETRVRELLLGYGGRSSG